MNTPLVDIIVPVYNVENYLDRCLESICKQTFSNIRIILVDDGSTDSSGIICDRWSLIDQRIMVIHQNNCGLGQARNRGLGLSSSPFVTFIDSDDWIEPSMIELMVRNQRKTGSDISIIGSQKVNEAGRKYGFPINDIFISFNNEKAFKYLNCPGYFDIAAWGKLYRRSLFDDVSFPSIKNAEDYPVAYKVMDKAVRIVYDSSIQYNYFQRSSGLSKYISSDPCKFTYQMLNLVKDKYPRMLPYAEYKHMDATAAMANIIYRQGQEDRWSDYLRYNRSIIRLYLFKVSRHVHIDYLWFIRLFMMGYLPKVYKFLYLILWNAKTFLSRG